MTISKPTHDLTIQGSFCLTARIDGRVDVNARRGAAVSTLRLKGDQARSDGLDRTRPTDEGGFVGGGLFVDFAERNCESSLKEVAVHTTTTSVVVVADASASVVVVKARSAFLGLTFPTNIDPVCDLTKYLYLVGQVRPAFLAAPQPFSLPRRSHLMRYPKDAQHTQVLWTEQDLLAEITTTSARVKTRLSKLGYTFEARADGVGWTASGIELSAIRFRRVTADGKIVKRVPVGAAALRQARRLAGEAASLPAAETSDVSNVSAGILAAPGTPVPGDSTK